MAKNDETARPIDLTSRKMLYILGAVAVLTLGLGFSLFTSGGPSTKKVTTAAKDTKPCCCDPLFADSDEKLTFPYPVDDAVETEDAAAYNLLVEDLQVEITQKNQRISELEARVLSIAADQEDEVRVLRRQLDAATGNMENTLLEELTQQIQEKNRELRLAQGARNELQAELGEAESRIRKLETRLLVVSDFKQQLAEKDEVIAMLEGKNKALVEKLAALPADIAELERDAAMTARLKEALADNEALIADLVKQRRDMEVELNEARNKTATLENKASDREQLAKIVATKEQMIDDLNRARTALLDELSSSTSKVAYLEENLKGSKEMQEKLNENQAFIQQLQQDLKQARKVIASFDKVQTTLGSKADDLAMEDLIATAEEALLDSLLEKKTLHPVTKNRS